MYFYSFTTSYYWQNELGSLGQGAPLPSFFAEAMATPSAKEVEETSRFFVWGVGSAGVGVTSRELL